MNIILTIILLPLSIAIWNSQNDNINENIKEKIYLGADMSYVNEMEECAGVYREAGKPADPYKVFADAGMNLVRLRLWHTPEWTNYSNFNDVKKSLRRAKNSGAEVLLDFHYSDDWADPGKQLIPKAWKEITDQKILGDSVYNYTKKVLMELDKEGLLPEIVQIGNETNSEVMMPLPAENYDSINWQRNTFLLNSGLRAVSDVEVLLGVEIQTMLHIAQPENALWWFPEAFENGINDFDWIGLSYYPKWSEYALNDVSKAITSLTSQFQKRLMIVETAYPSTLINADPANNLLGEDALVDGFPATPQGQKDYMITLTREVIRAGGEGVIYWEPAWISNSCNTRWGQGSHWDNATFFDSQNNNEVLQSTDFFNRENY